MLSKLLKYDLKFLFRFWWIGAIVSQVCAVITGISYNIEWSDKDYDTVVYVITSIASTVANMGIAVFVVSAIVLVYIRYYRNFFTDEGYLTFTLPVKRIDLLNSKLISGSLLLFSTILVYFSDRFIINAFTYEKIKYVEIVTDDASQMEITALDGLFQIITLLELIAILIVSVLFINILIFFCITFGSMITRKARVITSIGLCYGFGVDIVVLLILVLFAGAYGLDPWMGTLDGAAFYMPFSVVLLMIILFIAAMTAILYTATLNMLKGKLNLR